MVVKTEYDDSNNAAFLSGGGEMGKRFRTFDWSKTPLGPVETWQQSLKTAVRIMLNSHYPMFVWWGESYINLYNDAYMPILGERHPEALGQPAADIWTEIWPVVGAQADLVLNEGKATWNEDALLFMSRNQFLEETYFTFSYSPIPDDDGGVGGVFCACTEETRRVLSQRRLNTLQKLAEKASQALTPEAACTLALSALQQNPNDLPFGALYLLNETREIARLISSFNITSSARLIPDTIEWQSQPSVWPFKEVAETGTMTLVERLDALDLTINAPWPERPRQAALLPLSKTGTDQVAGFILLGISTRLVFNNEYRAFLELITEHISTAVANAHAYEKERERAEALAELDRAKTDFFSNVSHEFRTPLTLMLGPLEEVLQTERELPQAERESVEVAHRNSLRLLKLVNTMLDFSRIEAGRIQAVYVPTDLANFTAELASVFRTTIERAGLSFAVETPPLPEPVYVDRDMWEKIVLNLLSNAFKFTHEGEIAVSLHAENGTAKLVVRDSGVGIPANELPHVFNRFHRVKETRGRTFEGTGIGLALVQELAKLHGGAVTVQSELNEGSIFSVSVPFGYAHLDDKAVSHTTTHAETSPLPDAFIYEASRWLSVNNQGGYESDTLTATDTLLSAADLNLPRRPTNSGKPRIVWADDNADMRRYVTRLLEKSYDVVAVRDGHDALVAVREAQPDLILSDIMMPNLDGIGLLRAVRESPDLNHIPIIFLSARAGEEAKLEGLDAGADDYLIKPFTARELLARIDSHIRLSQLRQRSEAAVRESETRYRSLFDSIDEGFCIIEMIFDPQGNPVDYRFLETNPIFSKQTGIKDAKGKRARELFPTLESHWFEIYGSVAKRREPIRFVSESAEMQRWFNVYAFPFADQGDNQVAILFSDITQHKLAEQELRKSEERYRSIFDNTGVSVLVVDFAQVYERLSALRKQDVLDIETYLTQNPDVLEELVQSVKIRDLNQSALDLFQAKKEEVAKLIPSVFTPQALSTFIGFVDALARGESSFSAETKIKTLQGEERSVVVGLNFDQNNRDYSYIVITVTDITLHKKAERSLRESEQRFKGLADTAPAMLWLTDTEHHCTFLSHGWYEFTGQTEAEGLRFGWLNAIFSEDRTEVRDVFIEASKQAEPFRADFRLWHVKTGTYRWAVTVARPYYSDVGDFLGFIGSVIDMHERMEAEEALRKLNEQLEQRVEERTNELELQNRRLRQLANQLTKTEQRERRKLSQTLHDGLQQILVAGKIQLNLLLEDNLSEGAAHLEALFDEAIQVSRSLSYDLSPPALYNSTLPEALKWLAQWFQKNHHFSVEVTSSDDFPVLSNELKEFLFSAIRELLFNAVKHAGTDQGAVELLMMNRNQIAIIVTDEGEGFDVAQLEQEDRELKGFGLFSISERLNALGGSIVIDNFQEKGSRFVLLVPFEAEAQTQDNYSESNFIDTAVSTHETTPYKSEKSKIEVLLVDDHNIVRKGLMALLEREPDIEIVGEARDGVEAIQQAEKLSPDVIIMDIDMPRMNGVEATRHIRHRFPHIQIIGLSLLEGQAWIDRMRHVGMADYLMKGGDVDEIVETIRNLF